MNQKLDVGQLINVDSEDAVVSMIYPDQEAAKVEVVYLQNRVKYIFVDVYQENDEWHFVSPAPHGGYADGVPRLRRFVEILRVLHHRKRPPATRKESYPPRGPKRPLRSRR
jgi:hypothetical protein